MSERGPLLQARDQGCFLECPVYPDCYCGVLDSYTPEQEEAEDDD